MIKKITKWFAIFLLIEPLVAVCANVSPVYHGLSGVEFGLGIGLVNGQFQTNSLSSISPSFSLFSQQQIISNTSNTNFLGNIFLGKMFAYQSFLLGPEIYLNIGNPKTNWMNHSQLLFPDEELTTQGHQQLNLLDYGIDGKLGIQFNNDGVLYARVGASLNTLNTNITTTDTRPNIPLSATTGNFANHSITGLRLGLGLEKKLMRMFSLRGDYIYTYYPSFSQYATGTPTTQNILEIGPVANQTSTQTSVQAVLISIVYHWGSYEK